eukprot:CAMPEP_0196819118 /NCGR_PEP_ID=MMETSP1362-20130617/69131_1 /TAXON_ID=163516 /ORGANISM="Leptocylindrus danicus, Strain CCMP1856" /LENGTH=218 /DNA_ID=CAMNT_0042197487 /DNA_START=30 /DNA_END=686 /DNA_ORIENTATION=+
MGNLFGKEKPLKEVLRENKRMINRAVRELDRERASLEKEEKRLVIDIKKFAKAGQNKTVKIMAKDLVRTRQHIAKFIEMRSHLQGTALKLQTVKSHQAMADAMMNTAKALTKMNKAVDAPGITKMMAEFERENAKNELMQEVLGEAIDGALEQEGDEDEQEAIVGQVLDEIGIGFDNEVPDAPIGAPTKTSVEQEEKVPETADPAVTELEARLNNLKR